MTNPFFRKRRILRCLGAEANRELTALQIAESVGLRKGTVWRLLFSMQGSGLVERRFEHRTGFEFYKLTDKGLTKVWSRL